MRDKIKNPWYNTVSSKEYFEESNIVYQDGDYKIYKQFERSFLYVYKNIAFNQLAGLNKEHVTNVKNRTRPAGKYSSSHFLYDQAIETLSKQIN